MDYINKLTELFRQFPGIGPRQARRFAYHVLSREDSYANDLIQTIQKGRENIYQCSDCRRMTITNQLGFCDICANTDRENSLMVLAKDTDLESIDRTNIYRGYYFITGGLIPLLDKNPDAQIHTKELLSLINRRKPNEIILSLAVTTEGIYTTEYLAKMIKKILPNIKVTILGRGLSNGSELEYVDSATLTNALQTRSERL